MPPRGTRIDNLIDERFPMKSNKVQDVESLTMIFMTRRRRFIDRTDKTRFSIFHNFLAHNFINE